MKKMYVLRLNKIENQDVQNNKQRSQSPQEQNAFNLLAKSLQRREQTFFKMMQKLMKQNSNLQNKILLEPRDRTVIQELPDPDDKKGNLLDDTITQWITQLCSRVFSNAFHAYSSDQMSYQQTKVFCSQGILKNIILLTEKYSLDQRQIKLIDTHINKSIIPYIKKKYPMTESLDVNKALQQQVRKVDNKDAIQNDLLLNSNILFTFRQDGNYNDLIMQFLNQIMGNIDEKEDGSKMTVVEEFTNFMSNIFNKVYDEKWMNPSKNVDGYNQQALKTFNQLIGKDKMKDNIDQKYASKVREYHHYLIGRKISKNVQLYTESEIQGRHLLIRNPAVLRLLTKWAEQLWEKFTKKNYFLDGSQNIKVQQKNGNINTMFLWMKVPLNDLIQQEKDNIQKFMNDLYMNVYDQQAKLLIKQLQKDGFTHIQRIEKAAGKFAYQTVCNLHSYIIIMLNRIIHGLLKVAKRLYQTKLYSKALWTAPPNLLSFKTSDLLRCKCDSKQRQILRIYQQMNRISDSDQKFFKIYRVKNRLKTGTNDILVNFLFKGKYLCEVQLGVTASTSKWIKCSNKFNHYIYQLGRSLFGPITQLCSVWMSLDERSQQYRKIVSSQKRIKKNKLKSIRFEQNQDHKLQNLTLPFICSNCQFSFSHGNYIWHHKKKKNQNNQQVKICAYCRFDKASDDYLKQQLLKDISEVLKSACGRVINKLPQAQRKIPNYGLCIKITSLSLNVYKFKKLQIKKVATLYAMKQNSEQQKKIKEKDFNRQEGQKIQKLLDLSNKKDQEMFFRKYLIFEIPDNQGQKHINITQQKVKKQYLIPQKVKKVYKQEQKALSLKQQKLNDNDFLMLKGSPSSMNDIQNLQLADNLLTKIQIITENFPNLKQLQLSRNKIQSVESIGKLKFLTKLNLRDNQIVSLPDSLCQLVNLQGLNIRNNKIAKLPQNFGNLVKLKKLQADKNQFSQLPQSFSKLVNLKFLDLSSNKLTRFPQQIRLLSKLGTLSLNKNSLETIPDWISQIKSLVSLQMSKSKLKKFPTIVLSMIQLQTLKFECQADKFQPGIQNLINLKCLTVQMPHIPEFPAQIAKLNKLQTLEIQDCKLKAIPAFLKTIQKLKSLSLINNGLVQISDDLTQLPNLRNLKLQSQQLSNLPEKMSQMVQLRTLSLASNRFKTLPMILHSYPQLYQLNVKNNQLQSIPNQYFQQLKKLQSLQLDNNKLTYLPKSLRNLLKIKKFTYKDNPLKQEPPWAKQIAHQVDKGLKLQDQPIELNSPIKKNSK